MNYNKIIISAPAKINLYLEILNKFENGYHEIDSIMQTVDLADTLIISSYDIEQDSLIISLVCNNINIPVGKNNLAYIAAEKFCEYYKIKNKHIYINIDKKIPISAGLAGGSTDAAAVLIGLNELYSMNNAKNELCKIGAAIGADVPFCIIKGTMFANGIGEILTTCPSLPDCEILIAIGETVVSTKTAFEMYDLLDLPKDKLMKNDLVSGLKTGNLEKICDNLYNTFENLIDEAEITAKLIKKFNPVGVLMSGSGPAVYAIFNKNDKNINKALKFMNGIGYKAFKCKPSGSQDFYIK